MQDEHELAADRGSRRRRARPASRRPAWSRSSRTAWSARGRSSPARSAARRPARSPATRSGAAPRTGPASGRVAAAASTRRRASPPLAGRKPTKTKPLAVGVAGDASAASALLAPGIGTTRWPAAVHRGHQLGARVADGRRAGIADVGHPFAAAEPRQHRLRPPRARCARAPRAAACRGRSGAAAARCGACPRRRPRRPAPARGSRAASGRRGCRSAWRRRTASPAGYCWPPAAAAPPARASIHPPRGEPSCTDAVTTLAHDEGAGRRGRDAALAHLPRHGLVLVRRNYRVAARAARARRRGRPDHARARRHAGLRRGARRARGARIRRRGGERRPAKQRRLVFAARHFLRAPAARCRRAASTWSRSTATASSGCGRRSTPTEAAVDGRRGAG